MCSIFEQCHVELFICRKNHANNEIYRVRKTYLERACAGQPIVSKLCVYCSLSSLHSMSTVQAHFTASEVQFILNKKPELKENKNCQKLYLELRKNFGVKPQYSELLMLCKNCRLGSSSFTKKKNMIKNTRIYFLRVIFEYLNTQNVNILGAYSGHPTAIPALPTSTITTPRRLRCRLLPELFCLSSTFSSASHCRALPWWYQNTSSILNTCST